VLPRSGTNRPPSGRKPGASLCTATLEGCSARTGAHAPTETVLALAAAIIRLIRTLHDEVVPVGVSRSAPPQVAERRHSRDTEQQSPLAEQCAKTTKASRNTDEGQIVRIQPCFPFLCSGAVLRIPRHCCVSDPRSGVRCGCVPTDLPLLNCCGNRSYDRHRSPDGHLLFPGE